MKESEFIEQNKEKWLEFENNLLKNEVDPSKTSKLFVQVVDDLSYARTFYKNRSVKLYLNGAAKLLFNDINRSHKRGYNAFLNFWKKDLPLTMYQSRRAMLISFLVFVACFILGVVTSIQDKDFARSILSSGYVNMTNENIKKGDPMAVYKSQSELHTFLPILYNNLRVDFLTFFSGVFMAIGSLIIMVYNGVMVGVFQYFFIERGLFWESFLAIWTHGTLEISTIVLSGGAGLTLGKGLLFPGTYSRFQAFRLSGMKGLKIILGVAPITFLAAFIEGFLTRHTSIPDPLRFLFILMSLAFVLAYFFFYPRRVAKQSREEPVKESSILVYKAPVEFDPSEIYTVKRVITETFRTLFKNFLPFGRAMFLLAFVCAILIANNPLNLFHDFERTSLSFMDYFDYINYPALGILTLLCIVVLGMTFLIVLKTKLQPGMGGKLMGSAYFFRMSFAVFLCFSLFVFTIFTDVDFTFLIAQIVFPLLVFVTCVSNYRDVNFYEALGQSGGLLMQSWSRFVFSCIFFLFLSILMYFTTMRALNQVFLQDALVWALTDDEELAHKISLGFYVFQTFFICFMYLATLVVANSLLYFTFKEMQTAEHLLAKIKAITISK